jgi:tetratricopeptide (TPR) repeat protein
MPESQPGAYGYEEQQYDQQQYDQQQYDQEQYDKQQYAQAEAQTAPGAAGYPYPQEGYPPEGEEGWQQEAGASPFVLMLGWVLFGISLVGLLAMAYFLKTFYEKAKAGAGSTEVRAKMQSLESQLTEQANVLQENKNACDKANERADKLDAEVKTLREASAESEAKYQAADEANRQLEAVHKSDVKALREAKDEIDDLRDRVERAEVGEARGSGRLKGIEQALRAAEILDRPARWGEALGYLDVAIEADPDLDSALLLKGRILAGLGKSEEAVQAFDKVDGIARAAGGSGHARALVAAGDICRMRLKDEERALGFYRRAAEAAPGSAYGRLAEIRELVMAGGWVAALRKIENGIEAVEEAEADATPLRMAYAEALATDEEARDQAIDAVSKVIAADPVFVPALDLRAGLLAEDDQLRAAVGDLARAAELDPSNGERLVDLGRMLLDLDRAEAAEPILSRAVKALPEPESTEALTMLASALIKLDKPVDAMVRISKALDLDPGNVGARRLRGEARVALGRTGEGVNDLKVALDADPDDAHTHFVLARIYLTSKVQRFKNPVAARKHAQAAVELTNSGNAKMLETLAAAHAANNDYQRATTEMRKAVQRDPANDIYRRLLLSYEKRSR